jgi:ElaA protein
MGFTSGAPPDGERLTPLAFRGVRELTPREIHDMYRLRAAVFIVEQDCVFQDVDGADPQCWHSAGLPGDELSLTAACCPPA